MKENTLKEKIMIKAVELFSDKGYYGTTIREIANSVGCSLPMLYYYFKNKNDLYEEIAYVEFTRINERLKSELPKQEHIKEIYTQYILQRKKLSEYEKSVYKLALKAWMRTEGNIEIQIKLKEWEESRIEHSKSLLKKHWGESPASELLVSIFIRWLENMIDKLVLINEDIPEKQIRSEINMIFACGASVVGKSIN